MKRGILLASFGTTHLAAAEKTILALEGEVRQQYPQWPVVGGCTSRTVYRRRKERGEPVRSVEEAFDALLDQGVTDVLVQPTHLLSGWEFEKLGAIVEAYRARFYSAVLGRPLLDTDEDIVSVCRIVADTDKPQDGEAVVLMGHGTDHHADQVYQRMNETFAAMGWDRLFIATVEGSLTLKDALARVKEMHCKRVRLVPLMLVAGDHVVNDMAGDQPDSWKSAFQQADCTVKTCLRGLGELPEIRRLYRIHLQRLEEAK